MQLDVFAYCVNLHLVNDDEPYKKFRYHLTRDSKIAEKWFYDNNIIQNFGRNSTEEFVKNPYFYFQGSTKEIQIVDGEFNLSQISEIVSHFLTQFPIALWFIRDNSVNIGEVLAYQHQGKSCISRRRFAMYSSSKGRYENAQFSTKEMEEAEQILKKFINLQGSSVTIKGSQLGSAEKKGILQSPINAVSPKEFTRFVRASQFLQMARTHSYLPIKIMFYGSLLESLFTTTTVDVAYNIRERASHYLGGTQDEIKKNKSLIKEAYDIRSKVTHGQSLKKYDDMEKLATISLQIDEFIRRLLLKIINSNEAHNFIANDKQMNSFFESIMPKKTTLEKLVFIFKQRLREIAAR